MVRPRARAVIDDLVAAGRYHFTAAEMRSALGVSSAASKLALRRLIKKRQVASPARGFYVIVPPEYRSLGCLPADQFIPALMELREIRYYAALLSAAQYHGAAHQRPQEFQVALARNRRPIVLRRGSGSVHRAPTHCRGAAAASQHSPWNHYGLHA